MSYQRKNLEDVCEQADDLRNEFFNMACNPNASISDVEDLVLSYGVDLDYIEDLLF